MKSYCEIKAVVAGRLRTAIGTVREFPLSMWGAVIQIVFLSAGLYSQHVASRGRHEASDYYNSAQAEHTKAMGLLVQARTVLKEAKADKEDANAKHQKAIDTWIVVRNAMKKIKGNCEPAPARLPRYW